MANEIIFHLFQVATTEGSEYHLVDQFEETKDGFAAYEALISWYEGDDLTTETAEDIRYKLDLLSLSTKQSASEYINYFQQHNKQLTDLGEQYTKSKTVSIFLTQISDPDYQSTKTLCIENRLPLLTCIERIRARERRIMRDKGEGKKSHISIRRETLVQDYNRQDVSEQRTVDIKKYITEFGYYSIPND